MTNTIKAAYKMILLSGFALLITSCSSVKTHEVNGVNNYGINCSGSNKTIEVCYKKAEEICPRGYVIISNTGPVAADNIPWLMLPVKLTSKVMQSTPYAKANRRGITIQCK